MHEGDVQDQLASMKKEYSEAMPIYRCRIPTQNSVPHLLCLKLCWCKYISLYLGVLTCIPKIATLSTMAPVSRRGMTWLLECVIPSWVCIHNSIVIAAPQSTYSNLMWCHREAIYQKSSLDGWDITCTRCLTSC